MTNPKISVILSAYNEEKFIRKAIESVSNQTLEDIEIIIINDGSTDTTLDIINSYADKDNRQAAGRNPGYTGGDIQQAAGVPLWPECGYRRTG